MNPDSEVGVIVDLTGTPITIHRLRALWFANSAAAGSLTFGQVITNDTLAEGCPTPCDFRTVASDNALASTTKSVRLGVYCSTSASTSCLFRANTDPIVSVLGTQMTLAESIAPSATVEGGTLLLGALQQGTRTLTYRGADADSGVARLEALLDGAVVAARDFTADGTCRSDDLNACPRAQAGDLAVNTLAVPDGAHLLQLRISDAAQNQRIINVGTVTLDNRGDGIGPGDDPALRGAPNGLPAADQAKLFVSWSKRKFRPNLRVRYGRRATLSGRLVTAEATGIAGARLDVLSRTTAPGARTLTKRPIITGADGRFRTTMPHGVSSRDLLVRYRSHVNDTVAVVEATARLRVRAGISLRLRPRVTGGTVRFAGRVRGGPLPTHGKLVEVQARFRGHWRPVRVLRTNRRGRFSGRYRFASRGASWRFRARARFEAAFPYLAGTSHVHTVRVR
ncbi:MAG: hypothetical protein M3336_09465 [Chloroflexota bacterium]|nr:hypothetical protein [Chloroflexota bacterium]